MNNSRVSNSFVGFSPEKVKRIIEITNSFDNEIGQYLIGFNDTILNLCSGYDPYVGQYTTQGWFSDEATSFFENVCKPSFVSLYNKAGLCFVEIKTDVLNAYKAWSAVTGHTGLTIPSFGYRPATDFGYTPYPNNKDGIKGVDLQLYDLLKNRCNKLTEELNDKFNNSIRAISLEGGFLGASQVESMRSRLTILKKSTMDELDKVIAVALAKIKETSDKYNATATQVSNSFNN